MRSDEEFLVPGPRVRQSAGTITPPQELCSHQQRIVFVNGPLRVPLTAELRHRILARLRRGQHMIVLDLAEVTRIDAGGVGQLVRAYNVATAADGTLQVVHANTWVRKILERVGLYALLSGERKAA